jgi:hypothetical protein
MFESLPLALPAALTLALPLVLPLTGIPISFFSDATILLEARRPVNRGPF